MSRLELSETARRDLDEILDWLHTDGGAAMAIVFARKFDRLFDLFGDFPGLGSPKPKYGARVRMSLV